MSNRRSLRNQSEPGASNSRMKGAGIDSHANIDSLLAFEFMMLVLAWQYANSPQPITSPIILASAISGLFVADLFSGFVHIMLDHTTIRSNTSPMIRELCLAFQSHHHNPKELLQKSNLDLLRQTSAFFPIPFFAVLLNALCHTPKSVILTQIIAMHTAHWSQVIHKCAHFINHASDVEKATLCARALVFLQENRLLLSPNEHRTHHSSPKYDINFCIVNGWANPVLNFIVKHTDLVKQIKGL